MVVDIDGHSLGLADIIDVARNRVEVRLTPDALRRMDGARESVTATARIRSVYGFSTGVGANRSVTLDTGINHGLNLLRSHATDAGSEMNEATVRAMLVIRLSQLAAAGSGLNPDVAIALSEMLNLNVLPVVREFGGIGTADLPALAATALTLLGERAAQDGSIYGNGPSTWATEDALPFISSNALTIARAVLSLDELKRTSEQALLTSALSFVALSGNPESFNPAVAECLYSDADANGYKRLFDLVQSTRSPARIQDPFALRTLAQLIGNVDEEFKATEKLLRKLVVARNENPLVFGSAESGTNDIAHHGLFLMVGLSKRLDTLRQAIAVAAASSLRRISLMCDPEYTGLHRFLAADAAGQSGVMIIEYVAASALSRLRSLSVPVGQQTVVLSLGVEDDASFASESASLLAGCAEPLRVLAACELLCAVRALRQLGIPVADFLSAEVREFLGRAFALPSCMDDRDMSDDLIQAQGLLSEHG